MLISYLVNINLSYFQNGTLWYLYDVIFQISDAHLVEERPPEKNLERTKPSQKYAPLTLLNMEATEIGCYVS